MAWRTLATGWLVLVVSAAGCGTGGGSGGEGAAPSSSSTAGAGGESEGGGGGSGGEPSGGSGPGGAATGGSGPTCEETCAQIEAECAFDCPISCEMAFSPCVLGCASSVSCRELAGHEAPYLSCLGACDGGLACKTCVVDPAVGCDRSIGACLADAGCNAWAECSLACGDASCFAACDAIHIAAAPLYDPVYACICGSACADGCSGLMGLRCE